MGVGQLLYKQWAKGILYILLQAAFIVYLVMAGAADFFGLFTLGSVAANPWYGIEGDHSVIMMLRGILAIIIFIFIYRSLYFKCEGGIFNPTKGGRGTETNDIYPRY